jgi:hypothetical protein
MLPELEPARPVERWWSLPEATRLEVLTLLSRLIARGVLIDPDVTVDEDRRGDE